MLPNQKIIRVLFILLMVMTMNLSNALATSDPDDLSLNALTSSDADDLSLNALTSSDPDEPSLNDPAVPVDGGISLLLAAGAVYGARRLKRVVGKKRCESGGMGVVFKVK